VALGKLQSAGEIRRIPINGRLDQQRYRYALWRPNPLTRFKLSRDEAYTELARRFFPWIGPATLAEFQWFSGLGLKAAKAALAPLALVPLSDDAGRLILPGEREVLLSFRVPKRPQYVLVSSLDGITHLRRDVRGLLAEEDLKRKVLVEKSQQSAGQLSDLPSHGILDRGRLVGLWEYDIATQSIAWRSFVAKDRVLQDVVKACEQYIRDELGDVRSFSLDSPKSRVARIEALRKS
jgi:Winged helix DNA-binding domain